MKVRYQCEGLQKARAESHRRCHLSVGGLCVLTRVTGWSLTCRSDYLTLYHAMLLVIAIILHI